MRKPVSIPAHLWQARPEYLIGPLRGAILVGDDPEEDDDNKDCILLPWTQVNARGAFRPATWPDRPATHVERADESTGFYPVSYAYLNLTNLLVRGAIVTAHTFVVGFDDDVPNLGVGRAPNDNERWHPIHGPVLLRMRALDPTVTLDMACAALAWAESGAGVYDDDELDDWTDGDEG